MLVLALLVAAVVVPPPATGSAEAFEFFVDTEALSSRPDAPAAARLDSVLWEVAGLRDGVPGPGDPAGPSPGLRFDKGRVEVVIEAHPGAEVSARRAVRGVGATETGSYRELIRALVPPARLRGLAESRAVRLVRPPHRLFSADGQVEHSDGRAVGGWTTLSSAGLLGERTLTGPVPEHHSTTSGVLAGGDEPFADGFEVWPGPWQVAAPRGSATWGQTTYRASSGAHSAYCAGSSIAAPGPYANDMEAWLAAGPFDLSSLAAATLTFDLWLDTERNYDWLDLGLSTDGIDFTIADGWSGQFDDWVTLEFDLSDVGGSSYLGEPAVWIAFVFESDESIAFEGVYIDEVRIASSGPADSGDLVAEGVVETGADQLHAQGIDGTGVAVGVIDSGFAGYEPLRGDALPHSIVTWGAGSLGTEGSGSNMHGTAVAEIVHAMAPGAELYFAQIEDEVDLGNAVGWMRAQGVDVVNMSLNVHGLPGDGRGIINEIIAEAVDIGDIFWANSVGNARQEHWGGDFEPFTGDESFHAWGGAAPVQTFEASAGEPVQAFLTWDDDWNAASQDYDLVLLREEGANWPIVHASTNPQNGEPGHRPVESVFEVLEDAGTYGWAIFRKDATRVDVDFDFFDLARDLEYPIAARSFLVPADNRSDGFMAVAAIERSPSFEQAPYSGEGPTRDRRLTPHLSGPTAVTTVTYETFEGTSASSPHVAGGAALLRHEQPGLTAADVRDLLATTAIDLGPSGPDTKFGYGRMWIAPAADDDDGPQHGTIAIEPDAIDVDFGSVAVGESLQRTITVRNIGAGPLVVDGVDLEVLPWAAGEYEVVADTASGASIPPGGARAITVEFAPATGPSGPPDAHRLPLPDGDWNRLSGREVYSSGVLSGSWNYFFFRNTGGPGDLPFEATTAIDLSGAVMQTGRITGTQPVRGGDAYALGVLARIEGSANSSRVEVDLSTSYQEARVVAPVPPTTVVDAVTGIDEVELHRLGDALLTIRSNDPELREPPYPPGSADLAPPPGGGWLLGPDIVTGYHVWLFGEGVPDEELPAVACPPGEVPVAPFTDVSRTGTHTAAIDCAVWYGIAQGRTPTSYAPAVSVNRAQMASFVARLIGAGGGTLPPAAPQGFTDLDQAGVHAERINQLAAAGVVRGTSPTTYAPAASVTRAQMATFLVNAYEFVADTQLPAAPSSFLDIAGNTHETNIEKAAAAGFARGTTTTTYAPADHVRRDQMASFLTRVLDRFAGDGNSLHHLG